MGTLTFLYKRIFKNRVKKAIRKPVTYFYAAFILLYAVMLPYSLRVFFEEFNMASPSGMAALLTVFAFWVVPGNLIAYAKRKGLIYRKSDVHFLFTAPVSPKKILLYAHIRTLIIQTIMNLVIAICGGILFHVSWWRIGLYLLFSLIMENLLEGGLMLLLYGTERMTETGRKLVVKAAYGLVLVLAAIGVYFYVAEGLSLQNVMNFLHSDMVQMVPMIGWHVAVIHLIFMGPAAMNLIGTALYFVFLAVILYAALRMRCTGAFYEDAIKFADDYEEILENRRQGVTDSGLKRKRKYGKASVAYKGSGAKAIFYRQLLEYRKNRFFIFDASTVAAVIAGAVVAWIAVSEENMGTFADFLIPGATAYIIFIFTALSNKWTKEITSPYTYLIPDTAFKKLWYATAMQHIQALANGILITLPGAVLTKMSPLTAVLCVAFYVVLNANKLYALALAEALVGETFGKVGKQLFQLFLQGIVIGFAFVGALVGMIVGGLNLAYVLMIVFLSGATALFMLAATLNFYKMETA